MRDLPGKQLSLGLDDNGGPQTKDSVRMTKRMQSVLRELVEAGEDGISTKDRPGLGSTLGQLWRAGACTREADQRDMRYTLYVAKS